MADRTSIVAPFRGIRYGTGNSRDLSALIAPPYDIISPGMQEELRGRDPHNFVRIELPEGRGDDSDEDNRYTRAAAALREWLAEGALIRDAEPALYLVEQEFQLGNRSWRRRGELCLLRLPEPGENYVLSHEGTLASAKADRLRLMEACRSMTSPIMVMSEDGRGELAGLLAETRGEPEAFATDGNGVAHRLWLIASEPEVGSIRRAIGRGPLYIADGHHRFETALTYRDGMRKREARAAPTAAFNYALVLVLSAKDEALKILPTHRLIAGLGEAGVERLRARMEELFECHRWPLPDVEALGSQPWLEGIAPHRHVFGVYCGDGYYYVLIARDEMLPGGASLDVAIVHQHLIDPVIAAAEGEPRLIYVSDEREALGAVVRGEQEVALFLRPTRVSDVLAAANAGERMPGKSTYFYPKAPAGLVASDASSDPI